MYQHILVPLDGSHTSSQGLNEAIKLANDQHAQLRLLYIADERLLDCGYGPGTYGAELIETARVDGHAILSEGQAVAKRSGLDAHVLLVESMGGMVDALIVEQAKAWPADLIVMGTHGRRGLSRIAMGSDAESVLRSTPVPLLLVRGTLQPLDMTAPQ